MISDHFSAPLCYQPTSPTGTSSFQPPQSSSSKTWAQRWFGTAEQESRQMAPWTKVRTDKRNMDLIIVLSSGSEVDLLLYFCQVYKIMNDGLDGPDWLEWYFYIEPALLLGRTSVDCRFMVIKIYLSLSIMMGHTLHWYILIVKGQDNNKWW